MSPQHLDDSFKTANTAVVAAGAVQLVQQLVLVAFTAGLASLVARGEKEPLLSRVVLAAGVISAGLLMVHLATYTAVAYVVDKLSVPVVFGISTVGNMLNESAVPFLGLVFAGAGYGLARARLSPRWLGRLGMVAGGLLVAGSFSILAPDSELFYPMPFGILLALVWLLLANIALIRIREPDLPA